MITSIFKFAILPLIALVSGIGINNYITPDQNLGATIPTPVASFTTSLATGISSTDTTMSLVSITTSDGITLTDGKVYGFTIDEGTASQEYVVGTAETSDNTIITMTRGVSVITGNTSIAALKKAHRRGASVKITDHPVLPVITRILNGDETLPNILTYGSANTFTSNNQLVSKLYVDGVTTAGAPDASTVTKGISTLSTAPVSSTAPIAVGDNDTRVPTQDENNALVGTSGSPSTSNKYVTNDDTATAATANKVARRLASGDVTVPTTPTNATDAGSKAYIDAAVTAIGVTTTSIQNSTVHTLETSNIWHTWTVPAAMILESGPAYSPFAFVKTGTYNNPTSAYGGGGTIFLSSGGAASLFANVPGNGSNTFFTAASSKDLKFKTRVKWQAGLGSGVFASFGIAEAATTLDDVQTSVAAGIRFVLNNATLYASSGDGSANTNTDISGSVTYTDWNVYEVVFNPGTDIKFYVNGTLVATHDTNLPTGSLQGFGYGQSASATIGYISPTTFSLEQ